MSKKDETNVRITLSFNSGNIRVITGIRQSMITMKFVN